MNERNYPRCEHCGRNATGGTYHGGILLCPDCLDMDVQAWGELDEIMEWDE